MTYFTILILVILWVLWNTVLIVPMRENCIVERLGKFRVVLEPGLHILVPFFDRVAYRQETREQVLDVPSQSCISRDNIQIEVDGLVYLKVMDAKSASYGIDDYQMAAVNLAQTTMRSEIGKLALSETFSERDTLNEKIVGEIDEASESWGIKVLRYEIRNITPSANVVHTLEKQMEAEREKRAEITLATAERDATIALSEGMRQEDINLSEGDKVRRINEAEGRAQSINILADATAKGIATVAAAINEPGGSQAVRMQLVQTFIDRLGTILEQAEVSVLPAGMANIKGAFEGFAEASQPLSKSGRGGRNAR